jgi:D-alanyl-D-alanine carboxypeptidase/D-alanyl-D-alanine-endopeptidase (penicillin-binding protein 4)
MAEQILRTLAAGDGATAAASLEQLRAFTVEIGMPQAGLVLGNGSGLYANNMVSPAALTYRLAHVYADFRIRSDYLASLAIMGSDGTTRSRLSDSPAEGWVRVKTGTLDDVSALSGYAGATGRDPIAFSILFNGLERKHRAKARALQDSIAELLAVEAAQSAD